MGLSKSSGGTNKVRVQTSIVRLGLDLPIRLKEARLRVMREVKALCEILGTVLDANSKEATIDAAINAIQAKTHPREPYAAAARSQLRMVICASCLKKHSAPFSFGGAGSSAGVVLLKSMREDRVLVG
jgi:hypothetical protein